MPQAKALNPGSWSGYFELSSSIEENKELGLSLQDLVGASAFIALPLLYVMGLVALLISCAEFSRLWAVLLGLTCLIPIAATVFAFDFYRWVGLSVAVSMLSIIVLVKDGQLSVNRPWRWFLFISAFFAPIGAFELWRPFPLHQWLFERLVG